jgi:methylenetetrahydrofolate dehydrogenase (NADP+) / methenyltetrahydrofolate cyclohydrolase
MIIDGRKIAREINAKSKQRVATLKARQVTPGIAVILVGNDPASWIYTRTKHRLAQKLGIASTLYRFPADVDQATVLCQIQRLNRDNQVDAILVQEPLPGQLNNEEIVNAIDPAKDVDGLHPLNLGRLFAKQGGHYPVACTPRGIMALLDRYRVPLEGANVVIVGRSLLVGKPMLALLNNRNATVTFVCSHTKNRSGLTRQADVLIVAAGVPSLIKASDIKAGATVIDVGINRLSSGKLVGDVDYISVLPKARLITPVPGGVGPMTVAALISQAIDLAEWRRAAGQCLVGQN